MFGKFHTLHRCHSDDPQLHRGEEEPLPSDKFQMTSVLASTRMPDEGAQQIWLSLEEAAGVARPEGQLGYLGHRDVGKL